MNHGNWPAIGSHGCVICYPQHTKGDDHAGGNKEVLGRMYEVQVNVFIIYCALNGVAPNISSLSASLSAAPTEICICRKLDDRRFGSRFDSSSGTTHLCSSCDKSLACVTMFSWVAYILVTSYRRRRWLTARGEWTSRRDRVIGVCRARTLRQPPTRATFGTTAPCRQVWF